MHIQFVPAREAKVAARRDATSDQAEIIAQERKGRIVDDDTELALSAANRRCHRPAGRRRAPRRGLGRVPAPSPPAP